MSQGGLRLYSGVGKAKKVDVIEVNWPTMQKIDKFINVDVSQIPAIGDDHGIIKKTKPGA